MKYSNNQGGDSYPFPILEPNDLSKLTLAKDQLVESVRITHYILDLIDERGDLDALFEDVECRKDILAFLTMDARMDESRVKELIKRILESEVVKTALEHLPIVVSEKDPSDLTSQGYVILYQLLNCAHRLCRTENILAHLFDKDLKTTKLRHPLYTLQGPKTDIYYLPLLQNRRFGTLYTSLLNVYLIVFSVDLAKMSHDDLKSAVDRVTKMKWYKDRELLFLVSGVDGTSFLFFFSWTDSV